MEIPARTAKKSRPIASGGGPTASPAPPAAITAQARWAIFAASKFVQSDAAATFKGSWALCAGFSAGVAGSARTAPAATEPQAMQPRNALQRKRIRSGRGHGTEGEFTYAKKYSSGGCRPLGGARWMAKK